MQLGMEDAAIIKGAGRDLFPGRFPHGPGMVAHPHLSPGLHQPWERVSGPEQRWIVENNWSVIYLLDLTVS